MNLSVLKQTGLFTALTLVWALPSFAEPTSLEKKLKEFHENPSAFQSNPENVKKFLQKFSRVRIDPKSGNDVFEVYAETPLQSKEVSKFQEKDWAGDYIDKKKLLRDQLHQAVKSGGRALIENNDRPESLLSDLLVGGALRLNKLSEMEAHRSGVVSEVPWSSDYWPIAKGQIAKRYADPAFPEGFEWDKVDAFLRASETRVTDVDLLSPAEKYDLLVGDTDWTLTRSMLRDGEKYFKESGKVETWMGLCHGWAPAAFMEKRPTQVATVMAADGKTKIKFYPDDIKALATLLWAKSSFPQSFMGSRCNKKNPETDENGRITDQECFDTNPGSMHLALVNLIGLEKKSAVIDATYDYEVWNQPIYSYSYKFFNPKTKKEVKTIEEARVRLDDADFNDIFKKYRNLRNARTGDATAESVVGVSLDLVYIAETLPSHDVTDSPEKDRRVKVTYLYDLELDKDGKIVGGEWYHKQHPDFFWRPLGSSQADSVVEQSLDAQSTGCFAWFQSNSWSKRERKPLPQAWRSEAVASSPEGQPLKKIVKQLIEKSNQQRTVDCFGNFHNVN